MAPMALANLDVIQPHLFNWTQADAMDALWTQGVSVSPNFFLIFLFAGRGELFCRGSASVDIDRQLQPVNSNR